MTGFLRRFAAPPRRRQSAALRLGAITALLVVTAGCSGSALSSPPDSPGTTSTRPATTEPVTAPPPPAVGACRQLDYAAISHYSNDDPTVPCTSSYTAYTFAVETIPADVQVAGVSIGNKSIQDAASAGCRDAFTRFIGGDPASRALSRLSVTYFLPEQIGFNAGAHWVRCDVVALKTANSLAPLPKHLAGFLDNPTSLNDYGVCTQGVPGGPHAALVMCSEHHLYRALTALRLGSDAATYPGDSVTGKQGQARCAAYLNDKLGASTGYTYGWTYPTSADWEAGQRFGYCWLKMFH